MAKNMESGNQSFGPPKRDDCADTVSYDPVSGLVRIDDIPAFYLVAGMNKEPCVRFLDRDKYRSSFRGTRMVEIPLRELIDKLEKLTA